MGAAIYFDGRSSARQEVLVVLAPDALEIATPAGVPVARWPYAELVALAAPEDLLRVTHRGAGLARLEIRDPQLMAAVDARAGGIDRSGASDRRSRRRVVAWSLAAVVSASLVAVFGVPAIATRLAPFVPAAVEQRLGATIDRQLRTMLDGAAPLECGTAPAGQTGRAAFAALVARLATAAGPGLPVHAAVIRRPEINAMALPGGYVYVFRGLLERAETPDELAGIIAHEMGHVVNRDGTRAVLEAAGLSFLFGMLLGDFGGGSAVVVAARTVLRSAYSRAAETAADLYGARLVAKAGGDPHGLGELLTRVAGASGAIAEFLLDHPEAAQRRAVIAAVPRPDPRTPLLTTAEWTALKAICTEK